MDVSELYEVVDYIFYNSEQEFCPVLLKLRDPILANNFTEEKMEKSMDQYDEDRTHNQEESKMRFNHNGRPTAVDADRFMSHDTET